MSVFNPFSSKRITPLGITCSAAGYRCVQLDLSGEGRVRVATPLENTEMLKHATRLLGGARCVVAPRSEDVILRPARMPLLEGEEFRDAARWEAAQLLKCHADELVAEPMVVSDGVCEDGRLDVLIVALQKERVSAMLEPLLVAGLRPVAVEPSFLAAGRAFALRARRREDAPVARAVVEVASTGSNLVVMSGDRMVFAKVLSIGGMHVDDAVAKRCGVTVEEARLLRRDACSSTLDETCARHIFDAVRRPSEELANELAMSLRYAAVTARIGNVEAIHTCGEEVAIPGLEAAIEAACPGVTVGSDPTTDRWLKMIQTAGDGSSREWAVALGLAMRPVKTTARRRAA